MSDLERNVILAHNAVVEMFRLDKEIEVAKRNFKKARTKYSNNAIAYFIGVGGIAFVIMMFSSFVFNVLSEITGINLNQLFLLVLGFDFVGSIMALVWLCKRNSVNEKEYCAKMQKQIEEQEQAFVAFTQEQDKNLSYLPVDYRYPMATDYLVKIIQSERADTLKEALGMYDEQLHRWKMESAYNNILQQQKMQTQQLSNIRVNTGISAAANVVNAVTNLTRY